MNFSRFEALTFDIIGTLIDYRSGALVWLRERLAQSSATPGDHDILAAFETAEMSEHSARPGTPFTQILPEAWRQVAARFDVTPRGNDGEDFIASIPRWPAFDDSVAALARLGRQYRLVAITNADRWAAARMAATLDDPFEEIITAEDVGITKPDHRPFHAAFAALAARGIAREHVLHVAQGRHTDLTPAAELGLPVVWVNRNDEPRENARPDLEVSNLAELAEQVDKATG